MNTVASPELSQTLSTGTLQEIPRVLAEYLEVESLYDQRRNLLQGSTGTLTQLLQLDLRIDSHLDGLRIGDPYGKLLTEALESPSAGLIFLATVRTLESKNTPRLKQLLALAETDIDWQQGLLDAFSWVPLSFTQPLLPHLLAASSAFFRRVGLHLYRQHQIHADTEFERALTQADTPTRLEALNAVGEIGLLDLLPHCLSLLEHKEDSLRFAAARACLLLGERQRTLPVLSQLATTDSDHQTRALSLLTAFLPPDQAHAFLSHLASQTQNRRLLIQAAGELGDPANIPALLRLMQEDTLSRIAAQAFCLITGIDLIELNLDQAAPADFSAGPTDDPNDPDTSSDPDESLPWPNRAELEQWWSQHSQHFTPRTRYLAGLPPTATHCHQLLAHGNQAQQTAAALQLKAQNPATPLFLLNLPAWRQQHRLQLLSTN